MYWFTCCLLDNVPCIRIVIFYRAVPMLFGDQLYFSSIPITIPKTAMMSRWLVADIYQLNWIIIPGLGHFPVTAVSLGGQGERTRLERTRSKAFKKETQLGLPVNLTTSKAFKNNHWREDGSASLLPISHVTTLPSQGWKEGKKRE